MMQERSQVEEVPKQYCEGSERFLEGRKRKWRRQGAPYAKAGSRESRDRKQLAAGQFKQEIRQVGGMRAVWGFQCQGEDFLFYLRTRSHCVAQSRSSDCQSFIFGK